jgi:hypothetical protein
LVLILDPLLQRATLPSARILARLLAWGIRTFAAGVALAVRFFPMN